MPGDFKKSTFRDPPKLRVGYVDCLSMPVHPVLRPLLTLVQEMGTASQSSVKFFERRKGGSSNGAQVRTVGKT